jgi:hypothetical protein
MFRDWEASTEIDEDFLSNLKYDINILLETWKGADFCMPNFSIFQKSRKKKKCS